MKTTTGIYAYLLLISLVTILHANDYTKLSEKVYKKDLKGIEDLLAKGVDVNAAVEDSGSTVLLLACSLKDHAGVVEFLIAKGADVNVIPKRDGRSALMWAAGNSKQSVELLLANGAGTNIQAVDGMTAFIQSMYGVISGQVTTAVCDILLQSGEDINARLTKDAPGWTALMFAANKGKGELVIYLISRGADVNNRADNGRTALMCAAKRGYKKIVEILLQHGADAAVTDKSGNSALSLAKKKGHKEIVALLENAVIKR